MTKEKQIKDLRTEFEKWDDSETQLSLSEWLYNAGYRKPCEGKWQKRTFIIFDFVKVGYKCSICSTTWDEATNYCPKCGAKMKEEVTE